MNSQTKNWREPLFYLLASGGFIGLIFPMSQLAANKGISPLAYSGFSALGASVLLCLAMVMSGRRLWFSSAHLRYAAISGLFTYALSWGVVVFIIPAIGTAVPAIVQSATPIMTILIAIFVRLERPNMLRAISLLLGLSGVLLVLLPRMTDSSDGGAELWWYLLAVVVPVSLAIGNVYRSLNWPAGSDPLTLAALTIAAAGLWILALGFTLSGVGINNGILDGLRHGWPMIAAQSVLSSIGYLLFFRLQKVGGAVYLSQLSYVNTAVGLAFAIVVFGEHLPVTAGVSIALIVAGIALMSVTQSKAI